MLHLFLDLLVFTVASEKTDGYQRFIDSANLNSLKTKVINYFIIFIFLKFLIEVFLFRYLVWRSHGKEET